MKVSYRVLVYVFVALLYLISIDYLVTSSYHYSALLFSEALLNGSTKLSREIYRKYFPAPVDLVSVDDGFVAAHSAGFIFWAAASTLISKALNIDSNYMLFTRFRILNILSALMGLTSIVYVEKISNMYASPRRALYTALLYAVGTTTWVYSSTAYSQSFSMPFVAMGIYYLLLYLRNRKLCYVAATFSSLSIAATVDHSLVVLGIGFMIFLFLKSRGWMQVIVAVACYTVLFVPALLYYVWLTGTPLPTQHIYAVQIGTPSLDINRIFGEISFIELLFGIRKGLLLAAPAFFFAILVSLAVLRSLERQKREEMAFSLILFLVSTTLYSTWYDWHGGLSYGPRLLHSVLPFLAIPAALIIEATALPSRVFIILGIAGTILNAIVVATNPLSCAYQNIVLGYLPQLVVCNLPLLYSACRTPTLLGLLNLSCSSAILIYILVLISIALATRLDDANE